MYRSDDVREALRIAVQRGNDTAAWNSGMDRKQVVEEAEALFEEMVPVEPDLDILAETLSDFEPCETVEDRHYDQARHVLKVLGIGEDSTP